MRAHLALIGLLVVTLLAYAPVRSAGFSYEDDVYLSFAHRSLTSTDVLQPRGLTMLSFRLNGLWNGTDPQGYHAVNVALHLFVGVAFFGFARTLLPVPYALVAAGLALLHPIQTEAVAYVAGRAELFAALGTILAVWALAGPVTWTAAGLAFLATVFAIGGKELGLMALPLIALHALVIRRVHLRRWRTVGWALLGLMALVVLALPIIQSRIVGAWAYLSMSEYNPVRYFCTQAYAVLVLLGHVAWPSGLTVDHDYEFVSKATAILSAGLLAAGLLAAWVVRRRAPVVTFGVWWALIAIAPRFVVVQSELLNEHQLYSALLGVWLAASAGLMHLNAVLTKDVPCAESSPSLS